MIPNMMAEWDGNNDPQSPTFVLDIKFPFPDSTIANSASIESQRPSREFSFRLSIQMPGALGSAPIVQVPTPPTQSFNAQAQNAQQLEVTLREQLQRQRNSLNLNNSAYQRSRHAEASTLPTPPSTSPSDRLSITGGMDALLVGEPHNSMNCDVEGEQNNARYTRCDIPATTLKVFGNTFKDIARMPRNSEAQMQATSNTKRTRHSRSPSPSRSPSRRSPRHNTRYVAPGGKESRMSSESPSPVRSLRRGRSASLASRRGQSVDSTETRGRKIEYKRLQRSRSPVSSSHNTSRSPQSKSRSRSNGRDSYMHSRQRSVSTGINDELAVERASSGRYSRSSSPAPPITQQVTPSYSSNGSEMLQNEHARNVQPLQLRIARERGFPAVAPKRSRRRTCPFYHPTEKDRHPLDAPHPGYSIAEFDEAVSIYEKRGTLPHTLIKEGVVVNPKNRMMHSVRSPTKAAFTPGHQYLNSQSSSATDGYGGDRRGARVARSRSPVETPTKRRRTVGPGQHVQGAFRPETRSPNTFVQFKPKTLPNAQFRREGPQQPAYASRGPTNYFQNNFGSNAAAANRRQRQSYQQASNAAYYRS